MATVARSVPAAGNFPAEILRALLRGALRPSLPAFGARSVGRSSGGRNSGSPPRARKPAGRPFRRLVRWLERNRRLTVALLLCIAAGITVQQLTPAPAFTVSAFAAARDLPSGEVLGPEDLTLLSVPRDLVPAGSFGGNDSPHGKQLAVALRKGQLLSDSQLLGPGLLAGSPPGTAAVPLRMADPASIQLLSPGQLVNVVMTTGGTFDQTAASQVLAAAVPVLWTSGHGNEAGQWLAAGETEGLMVVAADADEARRLAGASTQGKLFFVLVGAVPG
ncbi:RcpC/CpaB family pilus assembly protein [Arthrobacter sp. YAF17]|uniref:RcpC/CpaB family pilus assembly protein n=1 Tax=Arthrobacter sp. YAF17 TaxID=3233077 RepID=UPI003F922407